MNRFRLTIPCLALALAAACAETGEAPVGTPAADTNSIDCAGDANALRSAPAQVLYQDGHEIHQVWEMADRADLWEERVPVLEPLVLYREQVRGIVPDTSALGMIRTNRERNTWLDREFPAEDRINRSVEAGVGRHRPMNCLESHLLAYQAGRFPLFSEPSEIAALILERSDAGGDRVRVYMVADDDSVLPKPNRLVDAAEADVANGWRLYAAFHNHTFNHSSERGLIPVASPSSSDVQFSDALHERLGLEVALVTDGFSTIELTAEEIDELALAVAATTD